MRHGALWSILQVYLVRGKKLQINSEDCKIVEEGINAKATLKNCLKNSTDAEDTIRKVAKAFNIEMDEYRKASEDSATKKRKMLT